MLSGNNGILQKATDAKTETEKGEVYEQISLATASGEMEYYSNGTDRITAYKNALLNGVDGIDRDNLIDNGSNLITGTVTTKSGKKYDFSVPVPVTDIILAEHDDVEKFPIANLNEGDEITYTDSNGNDIPCIVLYDSTSEYGIQIITINTISTVTLGKNDPSSEAEGTDGSLDRALWSYNNSIDTLNNAAENYRLANLVNLSDAARCVGSVPNNPDSKDASIYSIDDMTAANAGLSSNYRNKFENGDSNYTSDKEQMDNLGITKSNVEYWLASRETVGKIQGQSYNEFINVRTITGSGELSYHVIVGVYESISVVETPSSTIGLRPVFTLKSNIHYIVEDGTKKLVN